MNSIFNLRFKKIILSFLASFVLLFSIAPYLGVNAQGTPPTGPAPLGSWYNQDFFQWYEKVYDPNTASEIFGERYTSAQVQWVIYGLISFIFNMTGSSDIFYCAVASQADLSSCADAVTNLLTSTKIESNIAHNPEGKNLLQLVFADRSLSGVGYIKDKVNNYSLVPEAQAQTVGFGFTALGSPIQSMWRGARDVAFGLFVFASIIFAFMIMFRLKINPQTVITVQSAIPKVVVALIAVTFSYAIAGFMIDLMYVVIGVLSVVLSSFTPGNAFDPLTVFNLLVYGQPFGGVQGTIFTFLVLITLPFWIGLLLAGVIILFAGGIPGAWFLWLILVPLIIVAILILWICIKTIWALFKAFANIVLLTIFGPLQIALGVLIPNFGLGAWVRSYLSHLSVFVTTGVLAYLSILFTLTGFAQLLSVTIPGIGAIATLLISFVVGPAAVGSWAAGQAVGTLSPWPPLLGTGGPMIAVIFFGVAFVMFTMIPKATEVVQAFMAGKPFAYGSAIGEAFGPVRWGAGQAWNISGAKDVWELSNLARKSRFIDQNLSEGGRARGLAKWWIGGHPDEAAGAIDDMLERYKKTMGRTLDK